MTALHSTSFEKIADALATSGYAVVDQFLSGLEVSAILATDEFRNRMLHFRKAAIGKSTKQVNEAIRGDQILWIDPLTASADIRVYLDRLGEMIAYLNQDLYLSLKGVEVHSTVYPIGASYKRHLDQFKPDSRHPDHRKLSIICYLNENWKDLDGGQLRMYVSGNAVDIFPEAGKLVCFRSDLIEHEVLPATRERLSLTGWAVDRDPTVP